MYRVVSVTVVPVKLQTTNDHRGLLIEDLLDKKNFVILNNGQPTYTHQTGSRSHLDLSIVHQSLATNSVWEVMDDTLGSDHSPAITGINVYLPEESDNSEYFRMSKADWKSFKNNARELVTPDSVTDSKGGLHQHHLTFKLRLIPPLISTLRKLRFTNSTLQLI